MYLNKGCRSDLKFWSLLLLNWNGISFFYNDVPESSDSLKLFTDAAPSIGFRVFCQGQWFVDKWPAEFCTFALGYESSALFELYPIVITSVLWGQEWRCKHITMFCDNEAVVAMINKKRSPCPNIMSLLRWLTWQSVTLNFIFNAEHIPGHFNAVVADSLSRFRFQKFRRLCPTVNSDPLRCPQFHKLLLA